MTEPPTSSQNNLIYCYVKHYTHLHFFQQLFSRAFPQSHTLYFTDNVSLYVYAKYIKNLQIKRIPLFYTEKSSTRTTLFDETVKILNWEATYMQKSSKRVIVKYLNLKEWFVRNMLDRGVTFCWSGNNTESHAFGQSAKELNHSTYFGEITNYPQTVYLDPQGTNYFSSLIDKIKSEDKPQKTPDNDIEKLKSLKTRQKHIPQASMKSKIKVFIALYGIQQFLIGSGKRFSIWHRITNQLKSLNTREAELIKKDEFINIEKWTVSKSTSDEQFKILVPLQVNHDTQLHVFSNYKSSFEFIKHLLTIIDSEVELHIKLHPAEKQEINQLTMHLLRKLKQKNSNIQLISAFDFAHYDAVATINSTFGIDALLSNCKVITFGKSLYSDLDCVLNYDQSKFKTLRDALEVYDDLVNPDSLMHFAQTIQREFYNFNYFGDKINQGVSVEKFSSSITRLQQDISALLLSNDKK